MDAAATDARQLPRILDALGIEMPQRAFGGWYRIAAKNS